MYLLEYKEVQEKQVKHILYFRIVKMYAVFMRDFCPHDFYVGCLRLDVVTLDANVQLNACIEILFTD